MAIEIDAVCQILFETICSKRRVAFTRYVYQAIPAQISVVDNWYSYCRVHNTVDRNIKVLNQYSWSNAR